MAQDRVLQKRGIANGDLLPRNGAPDSLCP